MLLRPPAGVDLAVRRARAPGWRATRGEVQRWLEAVPVTALGLAPEEIFYVPRLRVRVARHRGVGPGGVPDRIISELRALLATAETGWGSGFSPGRPYRFRSRPAWQAWLVRLWVQDGSAAAREAFRAAAGAPDLPRWQRSDLLRDGPALVAVIARLAEAGIAARWIAGFEPADFAIAHRAIEEAFSLRLDKTPQPSPRRTPGEQAVGRPAAAQRALARGAAAALLARGNDWRPLAPAAEALLIATATLARAPSLPAVRAAGFAAAVWTVAALRDVPAVGAPAQVQEHLPQRRSPSEAQPPRPAIVEHPPTAEARVTASPLGAPKVAAAIPEQPDAPTFGDEELASPKIGAGITPDVEVHAIGLVELSPAPAPAPLPAHTPAAILAPDTAFATGFGGLLFLINAFVALGLYPDFTQPGGTRLAPSPLWLADRVGRRRFGARWRRDPLSNWIAAHGSGGRLPPVWRVEPAWLRGFEPARPRVTRTHGRTTRWHQGGFPLSDEPDAKPGTKPRAVPHLPAARSERWIACLTLYLDARLRLWSPAGLGLLALEARVEARDLELRASFALDCYPIELRLAGLDRNPGWQPAEGRSIAFAFA